MPLNTIVVMALAEQIVWLAGVATALGVGFTNTVAVMGVPEQLLAVGVMVKVTVTGALVVLVSVPLIFPLPPGAIPVTLPVLFLVQLYAVPATFPLNTMGVMALPEQIVWEEGVATASGIGFTSTVAVTGAPVQPLAEGVMVKVTVIGKLVVLTSVPLILPNPPAFIPVTVAVLFLNQMKLVPLTALVRTIVVMGVPEQTVCADGVAMALGVGFTNTVAVIGVPGQPLAVGVMVNVTVRGALVVLVSVPLILPLPLAAIPVTFPLPTSPLSLVQLKVVPGTLPVSAIVVIGLAEQMVCEDGVATALGVGLINTGCETD